MLRKLCAATAAVIAIAAVALLCSANLRAWAQANVPIYTDQGGAVTHIGPGGTLDVESGGVLNIKAGGQLQVGGIAQKTAGAQATTLTASDTVITGLSTVNSCVASMDAAPTTDPEIATCSVGNQTGSPAAGSILIQTWKTLGGTPAAATTFSKKVNWVAFGS